MCNGIDTEFDDSKMVVDGVNIPPEKQNDVKRIIEADKGLPAFHTDSEVKKYLSGERS